MWGTSNKGTIYKPCITCNKYLISIKTVLRKNHYFIWESTPTKHSCKLTLMNLGYGQWNKFTISNVVLTHLQLTPSRFVSIYWLSHHCYTLYILRFKHNDKLIQETPRSEKICILQKCRKFSEASLERVWKETTYTY